MTKLELLHETLEKRKKLTFEQDLTKFINKYGIDYFVKSIQDLPNDETWFKLKMLIKESEDS